MKTDYVIVGSCHNKIWNLNVNLSHLTTQDLSDPIHGADFEPQIQEELDELAKNIYD
jgi:hypothetical protein